jgi:hypothetical protein
MDRNNVWNIIVKPQVIKTGMSATILAGLGITYIMIHNYYKKAHGMANFLKTSEKANAEQK